MYEITRIDSENDPERCERTNAGVYSQCQNKRVPGSKFCPMHGGSMVAKAIDQESLYRLRSAIYQERVKAFRDNPKARSINDEIGVTRMLIEERINQCTEDGALILHAQGISDLVMKVQSLVHTAAKLDLQMNNTLSRAQVEAFTSVLLQIIAKHVPAELLEIISVECQAALKGM